MQRTDVRIVPMGRLRSHLIKGAAGSFGLQVGFAGLAFFNAIILARVLGAGGYGTFANAMAWVSLLTIPATFGFGILLVRDTAIYRSQGKWGLLKGLLRFSDRIVLVLSVLLALAAATAAGFTFSSPAQATMRHTIWIALMLLPIFALYNLRESAIRGLEYVIRARLPGMLIRPGLLLAGIGVIYFFWPNRLSAPAAMSVNVGAGVVILGTGIFFLKRLLPPEVKQAKAEYMPGLWLKAASPMLVYGGTQIVLGQTDIVMLGAMRGAHDVGLYAVAYRLSYLLIYVTYAAEVILAPVTSRMYVNGENIRLQKIITRAVRISFFSVLPFGLVLCFWGGELLGIFGHEFRGAEVALIILSVGRLLEVSLGSSALLLPMTGHERIVAKVLSSFVVANILLNGILIPRYGLEGAAIASVISLISVKSLLTIYAMRKTALMPTILGTFTGKGAVQKSSTCAKSKVTE